MKFIDLFSGIGGFRLALEKFNHKCVFSADNDKYACDTYYKNFKEYKRDYEGALTNKNILAKIYGHSITAKRVRHDTSSLLRLPEFEIKCPASQTKWFYN